MNLPSGARLGPYEIVSSLGAGGMGEVYRARDTRLDRQVAVKLLPSHLALDVDARARFEREARAIAAISHPNILAVHDFATEGATAYLVTELLEGESLRARLEALAGADAAQNRPGLPLRKAIDIAVQIAQGLAAAHDRHIAHRDLKPENIFVGTDGHVKILDFGLAQPLTVPASSSVTQLRTDPGTVMGTVGYMAPEQVKGHPADHRADIFAFGCVLWELLTGRRAFERATPAETMTAILREDLPVAADGVPLPPAIDQIVRHCLEKQPDGRRLAVDPDGATQQIAIIDLGRNSTQRVTFEWDNASPVWTPDGARLIFRSNAGGGLRRLHWQAADGSGAAEPLSKSPRDELPTSIHGRSLLYDDVDPRTGTDIWSMSLDDRTPRPFVQRRSTRRAPGFRLMDAGSRTNPTSPAAGKSTFSRPAPRAAVCRPPTEEGCAPSGSRTAAPSHT